MLRSIKLSLFCIVSFLLLLSFKIPVDKITLTPKIKEGSVRVTGQLNFPNGIKLDEIFVNFYVPHPISGENVQYKAPVDRFGKFSINIDVETNISLVGIYTSLNREKSLCIKLIEGSSTYLSISYKSNLEIDKVEINPSKMTEYDMIWGLDVMNKMIAYRPKKVPEPLYAKSPDYFLKYAKNILTERLTIVNSDELLSKDLKAIQTKDFRLFLYNVHVINYESEMINNYHNTSGDKISKPIIQKIDRTYFHFLKDFNLNDPLYLNCSTFPEFQKDILQNEVLSIPAIEETEVPIWMAKVKSILSDLLGFDNGQYYDILAANAYGRQLNEELRPLTRKQLKNIKDYFKGGEIAKILFRKHDQVVELDKVKTPAIVNEISSIPDSKVIETIVAKHKNKVILIDLWATWCAPCLDAMQQFRKTKNEFHDKDVTFIYITNRSSPIKQWEEKIEGIGNEHYYLTDSQWEYMMRYYGFDYIPSYLLFDKQGLLIKKVSSFPGNDQIKRMINDLL